MNSKKRKNPSTKIRNQLTMESMDEYAEGMFPEDEVLDAEGNSALILEVKAGNDSVVRRLIMSLNLNHQNIRGVTVSKIFITRT